MSPPKTSHHEGMPREIGCTLKTTSLNTTHNGGGIVSLTKATSTQPGAELQRGDGGGVGAAADSGGGASAGGHGSGEPAAVARRPQAPRGHEAQLVLPIGPGVHSL